MVSLFDELASGLDTSRLHAGDESIQSSLRGLQVKRSGDKSDPAVIQGEQMLQRFLNSLTVVDADICAARAVFAGVHEYGGNVAPRQLHKERRVCFGGHDGRAVYLTFYHAPNAFSHALWFVISVGDNDLEALLNGLILEMLHEFWKERVCDV